MENLRILASTEKGEITGHTGNMMKHISIKKFLAKTWVVILISLWNTQGAYAQLNLSKKERKLQDKEAKADRLFIEGQRFLMLEEYEKAYFYFGKALEHKPASGAINFKIAEILARADQNEEALKYGKKAVEADPDNKYFHLLIAEVYSNQKKPEKAAEVLNALMQNSEDNQQYILELASLYLASQEYDKALEALDRAEEYYGVVAQLSFQKQKIYLQKNDLNSAVEEGNKLIEAHPGQSEYVLALVEMLFNNGKTDQALEVVLQSLDTYPNQPDLQLATYTLYKEKDEVETAHGYLLKAFSNPELAGEVKAKAFGDLLRQSKTRKRDELLRVLEPLMLQHHPNDPDIVTVLGNMELQLQNKGAALGHFYKALELNPSNEEVLQNCISLMFELGEKFEKIETYTQKATEEFPEKAEFWFFDGTSKLAQKKYREAEKSLVTALEKNKGANKQLEILVGGQLGDTYHSLNKKEDSYKTYEKVLAQSPDNEHILNNYAYFLSLDKKHLDKAKTMSEKLVKKFPNNATYLDTHAWVLFQLNDYENARIFMEKALESEKEPSGVMYEHYGDILYKLGNANEALSYWKKAEGSAEASEILSKKIKNHQYYE